MKSSRRGALGAALVAATLALTACGGGGSGSDDGTVTLRFAWWGGDLRNEMTAQAIEAFEAQHPGIQVEPEMAPFDGFFDKIATQVAAQDAPDVIQINEGFFSEYVNRGALLDLSDAEIDHSAIDDTVWNASRVEDKQWAVPAGVSTPGIVANTALFKEAGIELPDDSTWTWDDYATLAADLSKALPEGKFGSQTPGTDQSTLAVWLRQNGSQLFSTEGLGFEAAGAASFFQFIEKLRDSGAIPGAEEISEQMGVDLAQSGSGTNRYAMGFWMSNQIKNLEAASGEDLALLKLPTVAGSEQEGQYALNSMWYSAFAGTDHPEEVAQFLDFMINSPEAGAITLSERGAPPNSTVTESIQDQLEPADQESIAFVDSVREVVLATPPPTPPAGASGFQEVLRRMVVDVAFDRAEPQAAAEQLIQEVSADIG